MIIDSGHIDMIAKGLGISEFTVNYEVWDNEFWGNKLETGKNIYIQYLLSGSDQNGISETFSIRSESIHLISKAHFVQSNPNFGFCPSIIIHKGDICLESFPPGFVGSFFFVVLKPI